MRSIFLLLVAAGCAGSGNQAPARVPPPAEPLSIAANEVPQREPAGDVNGLACQPDGTIGDDTSLAGVVTRARSGGVGAAALVALDRRSVVLGKAPLATLATCRGGRLRHLTFHRDDFISPDVDRSQIHPGLNQIGWYAFSPNGKMLVFAITGHSRRPNPEGSPPYQVSTLVSKFIAIDVDTFRYNEIDTRKQGFNRLLVSDRHIVFWGSDGSYRADFAGRIVRLTPASAQSKWGPSLSPDGRWMAEIQRDDAYVLTSVFEPDLHLVVAPPQASYLSSSFSVFSRDSSHFAFARYRSDPQRPRARDHTINIYDLNARQGRRVLSILGTYTCLMHVSPDNRELLVYSYWNEPQPASQVYCVALDTGRISVAPQRIPSGNFYVDDDWTTAEVAREQGQGGVTIPIQCRDWQTVDGTVVNPPGAVLQVPRTDVRIAE